MKCINLKCEYQVNPIGIDVENPRLSWQIESDKSNVTQISYTIQCSTDKNFADDFLLWDTGIIESRKSNLIEYEGEAFLAYQRVYWRVKAETSVGISPFSEISYFEMGLLDNPWEGEFITSQDKFIVESRCPVLKKKFELEDDHVSARLYITALGMYEAHINSKSVDQDILAPGWTSYHNHLQYQSYDVTDMISNGENILSVILGTGWYMGRLGWEDLNNLYGDTAALLAQLVVTYADGRTKIIKTDESWKSGKSAILYSEIYDGEKYDARINDGLGIAPYEKWNNAVAYNTKKEFKIIGQNTPSVRVIDEIAPIEIIITPKGDTVLDFGQNMVGWVKVKAQGNSGDTVHLLHGEIMLDDEFYDANMRTAKTEATYILSGKGTETFQPHFTFFGFRYVKLDKYPGEVKLENFNGIVISSDLEYGGKFTCSNEKVNKLFQNIIWGQKGNFVDIPTDCPQRDERLGWTADTQVFTPAACYNSLAAPFYEKWLKDVACDQFENGGIPSVVPDILRDNVASSAWGDAATIVPNILYKFYKDEKIISNQYDSMKKWVEYIRAQGETETLWNTGFHFSDWLAKDGYGLTEMHGATPTPLVATALYFHSTTLLANTAKILGYESDVKEYSNLACRIKETFNHEFVTPGGRVSGETQTAYTLALHFGLLSDEKIPIAVQNLAELVRREEHRITTGFVGTPYIALVLSKNGYNEDAYRMLLNEECPGWLYQINMGATTIWERWDSLLPDGKINSGTMNSFNHYAYGSIAQWLYEAVLGITPNDGFQTFNIAPMPCGLLSYASGGIDTLYGRVESSWELKDDTLKLGFAIPCNTVANVCLPFAKPEDIEYDGKAEPCEGGLHITLGSGTYSFNYSNKEIKKLFPK